jgi:SAM-dependent methyltransferase
VPAHLPAIEPSTPAPKEKISVDDDFWQRFPEELETNIYRSLHADLAQMSEAELLDHYENFGREEGRVANGLRDRDDFAGLIPSSATVLEIGPFWHPVLRGPSVSYFDVSSQEELHARATLLGLDPAGIPHIDYISATGDLSIIDRSFDFVISSHCLEHQPDLVGHLQAVEKILRPEGAYFLLVPDKRYCFDHFIPLSNLAEVVVAHHERRKIHTLRSVIECRALTTHNDCLRHWMGDHGAFFDDFEHRLEAALQEFSDSEGGYIDVHAWYFTPDTASAILYALQRVGLSRLGVQRVYSTRYGANEFWMILSNGLDRTASDHRRKVNNALPQQLRQQLIGKIAEAACHPEEVGHLTGELSGPNDTLRAVIAAVSERVLQARRSKQGLPWLRPFAHPFKRVR